MGGGRCRGIRRAFGTHLECARDVRNRSRRHLPFRAHRQHPASLWRPLPVTAAGGSMGNETLRVAMAGQVVHLAAAAEREHVQVRVIPAETPWHTGLAGPFVLAGLPDGAELAYVDNQLRGQVVNDPVDVAGLMRRWESVTGEALPGRGSTALIREVATTWS
ncbi:Scr1 family TA system antitoxin-like transcriptional regulator [Micromonospora carbonacea]|uniref:Scr1 family TA system antitoxin-like transcriptional regulator n=1 Tax=Micromonospora carbonacea TaxID=47853 RepID=UPI003717E000